MVQGYCDSVVYKEKSMSSQNGNDPLADRYQIVEANGTLMISESRVSLFDVMILHDEGHSIYESNANYSE